MDDRAIAFAIPVFFLFILVELAWNISRGDSRYRFHDSIASLSCGIGQILVDTVFRFITFGGYVLAWKHLRVATIGDSLVAWIGIIVGVDFFYYWFHRASHRVNFLWAMHAVHHQSEEYNLSTALRQSWLDPLVYWTFLVPLAIAGFTPAMYAASATLNLLYQFFIHTRAVKKLGPLEWVFNTPSHHRVHHGIDPQYIDKNYSGIFIVWDHLFGTFEPEGIEPVYGTVKPLASWNAVWANAAEWARIASLARGAGTLRERVWAWFAPPEWRPVALGGSVVVPEVDRAHYAKFETTATRGVDAYVAVSFAAAAIGAAFLMYFAPEFPWAIVVLLAGSIFAMTRGWGALMEGKRWAVWFETARWIATIAMAAVLAWRGVLAWRVGGTMVGAGALLLVWVVLLRAKPSEPAREAVRAA
jgi:sterol desaturase/sphingolipid hydroxylase (fatty acid hydroxylase superfamily)